MGDIPQNINFAIKTGAVRDFLDNSVVAYQSVEPGPELKTADIAQRARAFTMFIFVLGQDRRERKKIAAATIDAKCFCLRSATAR